MTKNKKMNKKIKLVASTASARIGTILFSLALIAILVSLIVQGVLNFGEALAITIGSIVATVLITVILFVVNFGGYVLFDTSDNEITLCRGFKKHKYSLELISKVQVEAKTLDLHLISNRTAQETKGGAGSIKQTEYKKIHYKMPYHKDLNQRNRYETFARKCNKILNEVIHKKMIVETFRSEKRFSPTV
jgi:low affinity Fe/Cu permease